MSDIKTVKLTLTAEEYEAYEAYARKNHYKSVPALAKDSLVDRLTRRPPATDKKSTGYSKAFINHFNVRKVSTDHAGKPELQYARVNDKAYPLYRQLGAMLPLLDMDEAFWIPMQFVSKRPYYIDYTDKLNDFEYAWLLAWVDNFDEISPLLDWRLWELSADGNSVTRADYDKVLEWHHRSLSLKDVMDESAAEDGEVYLDEDSPTFTDRLMEMRGIVKGNDGNVGQ